MKKNRQKEKGVSLLVAILALLLMTAIVAGMTFMSSTETSISSNFKSEESAYFAARAGIEEVRDRMLGTNANTIASLLPTQVPSASGGVLYILQQGVTMADVTNISSSNPVADDELCHDFGSSAFGGMTYQPANIRCVDLPGGSSWYTPQQTTCTPGTACTVSVAPYPLEYKWVRVTLKANYSYSNSTTQLVDASQPGANQVCWNGSTEVVLPSGVANCPSMPVAASPVYLVTSLAVMTSGARRIVQEEIAQAPPTSNPINGFFATGTGCPALTVGGNASTYSFNSSTPGVPPVAGSGNVGANGGVVVMGTSTHVNGKVSTHLPASYGPCPANGVSTSGSPTILSGLANVALYNPPVPPLPNPLPPQTNTTIRNTTMNPGSFGNVTLQGNVVLTGGTVSNPAVYTLNSLTLNGNANVSTTGPIIINLAGVNQSVVLQMNGNSYFANTSLIPSNLVINYGGTGTMNINGGNNAYSVINAPNAALNFGGGAAFYGSAVASTINDQGGVNLYWDQALQTPPVVSTSSFHAITLRELNY
ncbi:MAG TPA: PilX N-terminal domain-containing pilus assembly protein [Terriglobales bacterium]|nr:PilX N-terminal domain-containing pilus assembly protein [Terriglobales bacterium]